MRKVYIIPGWTYNLDKWQSLLPLLKQKDIEPVMLKVPGLTKPSDDVWDITSYVTWLHTELQGVEKPTVIGHSNGGRIALAYLQANPGAFQQLILIDSAGLANQSLLRGVKLKILRIVSFLGKPLARVPFIRKAFYALIGARDYNQAPDNMRQTMQHMLEADATFDLTAITTPVTMIWGSKDTSTPLQDGQKMCTLLPHATLHVIEGAGHAPQASHPAEVVQLIEKALV